MGFMSLTFVKKDSAHVREIAVLLPYHWQRVLYSPSSPADTSHALLALLEMAFCTIFRDFESEADGISYLGLHVHGERR